MLNSVAYTGRNFHELLCKFSDFMRRSSYAKEPPPPSPPTSGLIHLCGYSCGSNDTSIFFFALCLKQTFLSSILFLESRKMENRPRDTILERTIVFRDEKKSFISQEMYMFTICVVRTEASRVRKSSRKNWLKKNEIKSFAAVTGDRH